MFHNDCRNRVACATCSYVSVEVIFPIERRRPPIKARCGCTPISYEEAPTGGPAEEMMTLPDAKERSHEAW